MKKWILLLLCVPVIFFSCGQDNPNETKVERDTTITPANSFTGLFLDSAQVAEFIEEGQLGDSLSHLLRNFYNSRNYHEWTQRKVGDPGKARARFHFLFYGLGGSGRAAQL